MHKLVCGTLCIESCGCVCTDITFDRNELKLLPMPTYAIIRAVTLLHRQHTIKWSEFNFKYSQPFFHTSAKALAEISVKDVWHWVSAWKNSSISILVSKYRNKIKQSNWKKQFSSSSWRKVKSIWNSDHVNT